MFTSQKGAMFGMDARVALIIASVLAATGGISVMSKIERNRAEAAERGLEVIVDALESHYKTDGYISTPPYTALAADINTLLSTGYLEDASLAVDPWGNNWRYQVTFRDAQIEDVPVRIHMATIASDGKDGVQDTTDISGPSGWDSFAASNDDVVIKFSTIEIEKKRIDEYRIRAKTIIERLESYQNARYQDARSNCYPTETQGWCSTPTSYTNFNYYPVSNQDSTGAYYYDTIATPYGTYGSGDTYISGDENSMGDMMVALALPRAYALDPWHRVLKYQSNITGRTVPPFTASIWYND